MNELGSDSAETLRLLEEVRGGDRQAFDRLFGLHRWRQAGVARAAPLGFGILSPSPLYSGERGRG